jgi:outer membrane murein-binding lipoprotein Lpp
VGYFSTVSFAVSVNKLLYVKNMASRPIQKITPYRPSMPLNDIFAQPAKRPPQKQALCSPLKAASPKDSSTPTSLSNSPITKRKRNVTVERKSPYLSSKPSQPAEDETFMFATRQALEQAIGKASLERHEALLQQEKKSTKDYISQLEEVAKQKNGIALSMQDALVRKQIAMCKAKAEGLDESAKTEIQLLREWNGRMQDEMRVLNAVVEGLRKEKEVLREEMGGTKREDEDEVKRLYARNAQLEQEKEKLETDMRMMRDECAALKCEMDKMRTGCEMAGKQKQLVETSKKIHGLDEGYVGNAGAKYNVAAKRNTNNSKRRARDQKRRGHLLKENGELSAKLAQLESQHQAERTEALEARDEAVRGLQVKIEELMGEMREMKSRVECGEREREKASPTAALESKDNKRKRKKQRK